MPTRLLRDGILTSETVCSLGWAEEVFYRRLMSVADDHGRFHAIPKLLRASLYPLQIDKVSDADIGKWIAQCVNAGLVSVYPAKDGKRYLQIRKFGQQVRSKSKFPEPMESDAQHVQTPDNSCLQLPASAHLDEDVDVDEGGAGRKRPRKPLRPLPEDFTVSSRVKEWAKTHGYANVDAHFDHFVGVSKARAYEYADWDQALINAIRKDWAKLGNGSPQLRQVAI